MEDISRDDVPVSRFALSNFNTFEVGFLNIDITSNWPYQRDTQLPLLALYYLGISLYKVLKPLTGPQIPIESKPTAGSATPLYGNTTIRYGIREMLRLPA
jgi:hypothetical protein